MDSASLSVLCRHGDEIVKRLSVDYSLDEDTHASRPHTRPHTPGENVRDSMYMQFKYTAYSPATPPP